MTTRFSVRLILALFVTVIFAATLSAQTCTTPCPQTPPPCTTPCPQAATSTTPAQTTSSVSWNLYPYAGGIFPGRVDSFDNNKLIAQGIYGLKGGAYFGSNFELEGSFGYLNHFNMSRSPNPLDFNTLGTFGQPSIAGFLYDINFAWNFGNRNVFGAHVDPYVSVGGGGLTTEFRNGGSSAFLTGGGLVPVGGILVPNPAPVRVLNSGDTFFTINYGGGVKFANLWGPLGFRVDVRGRTLPNFFGTSTTWIEPTGGLLFSFGEK